MQQRLLNLSCITYRDGAQRARFTEKVHKPPLGVNVIDFELNGFNVELVSKELNHFGVIADLFRQIGGHST